MRRLERIADAVYQSFIDEQEAKKAAKQLEATAAERRAIDESMHLLRLKFSEYIWEALQECDLQFYIEPRNFSDAPYRAFAIFSYLGYSMTFHRDDDGEWLLRCDSRILNWHSSKTLEQQLLLTLGQLKHSSPED